MSTPHTKEMFKSNPVSFPMKAAATRLRERKRSQNRFLLFIAVTLRYTEAERKSQTGSASWNVALCRSRRRLRDELLYIPLQLIETSSCLGFIFQLQQLYGGNRFPWRRD